jgi:hypothetical protein
MTRKNNTPQLPDLKRLFDEPPEPRYLENRWFEELDKKCDVLVDEQTRWLNSLVSPPTELFWSS